MRLRVPPWLVKQKLSREDRAEIAAAAPDYRVTFVIGLLGSPNAFRCSIYDDESRRVARADARRPIEAFRAALAQVPPPEIARWRGTDVEVVDA